MAGAHVPDLAGLLAVAGQAGRGQRIDRDAVRAEASPVWLTPVRRNIAWSVRTWRSSPEWLAGHDRQLGRLQLERLDAAGLEQGKDPERLDGERRLDDVVGVAERPEHPAADVDLDDVAPVDALLDPVADLRGRGSAAPASEALARRPSGWVPCSRSDGTVGALEARPGVESVRTPPPMLASAQTGPRWPARARMPRRRSTSPSTRRSSTSSASSATRRRSQRSSARSSASCRGCWATRRWPTRACSARSGRPSRRWPATSWASGSG